MLASPPILSYPVLPAWLANQLGAACLQRALAHKLPQRQRLLAALKVHLQTVQCSHRSSCGCLGTAAGWGRAPNPLLTMMSLTVLSA